MIRETGEKVTWHIVPNTSDPRTGRLHPKMEKALTIVARSIFRHLTKVMEATGVQQVTITVDPADTRA